MADHYSVPSTDILHLFVVDIEEYVEKDFQCMRLFGRDDHGHSVALFVNKCRSYTDVVLSEPCDLPTLSNMLYNSGVMNFDAKYVVEQQSKSLIRVFSSSISAMNLVRKHLKRLQERKLVNSYYNFNAIDLVFEETKSRNHWFHICRSAVWAVQPKKTMCEIELFTDFENVIGCSCHQSNVAPITKIMCISLSSMNDDRKSEKRLFTVQSIDIAIQASNEKKISYTTIAIGNDFANESELFNGFLKIVHDADPDIMVGMKLLNYMLPKIERMSPSNRKAFNLTRLASLSSMPKQYFHVLSKSKISSISGRCVLDICALMSIIGKPSSFDYQRFLQHEMVEKSEYGNAAASVLKFFVENYYRLVNEIAILFKKPISKLFLKEK